MSDEEQVAGKVLADLEQSTDLLINAVRDMARRVKVTEEMQKKLATQQIQIRRQQQQQTTQHSVNWILGVSVLLDILLSVLVGFGYFQINGNADSIAHIQNRTSDQVLCPLYALFVQSVEHPRPDQVNTPEKKAQFEAAKKTILDGYNTLDCQK